MKEIHIKNLDIKINSGDLINMIGSNGSGKTVILKMISGRVKNDSIFIDNKNISEYSLEYKKNNIVSVFDDDVFFNEYVKDELRYYLNKLNKSNIEDTIKYFINYFDLENIIDFNINELRIEDKMYVKILSLLIINPILFCIDDLLTYLSIDKKHKILNYIKDNNITLLNITSNMEELLLLDKILVINKGKKELFDDTKIILSNENIFKELGLNLPFIYDINSMLKSYDLIKDKHIISKELVDMLWK